MHYYSEQGFRLIRDKDNSMIQSLVLYEQLHAVGVETAQLNRHEHLLETLCISAPREADVVGIKGHEFGIGYAEGDKSVEFTFSRFSGAAKFTAMKGEQVELTGRAGVPEIIACFRWVFAALLEEARQHRANVADVKLRAKEAMDRAEERAEDYRSKPIGAFASIKPNKPKQSGRPNCMHPKHDVCSDCMPPSPNE